MPRDDAHAIRPDELMQAYGLGYFPMARTRRSQSVIWVRPEHRGVILLSDARAPKKLRRLISKEVFDVRVSTDFHSVILECARETDDRRDTWINDSIIETYCELHRLGLAHSVECYHEGALVGGLYGVCLGGIFCGESMFSRKTSASKVAMIHLIALLKLTGFKLIDTQFYTDHLSQFGATEIPDADYQTLLARYLSIDADLISGVDQLSTTTVLQSITQTS